MRQLLSREQADDKKLGIAKIDEDIINLVAMFFDFVLDDSQAMGPQSKLSSASEVVLKARISKTGQAMAQPGELGVSVGPVKNPSSQLSLVIRGPMP